MYLILLYHLGDSPLVSLISVLFLLLAAIGALALALRTPRLPRFQRDRGHVETPGADDSGRR